MKLIPLKTSLSQDKTFDEKKILLDHVSYWTDLQAKGHVIVFGPVMDPKGAWGMGVIESDDEPQVLGFKMNDPVIKAGTHTMEIFPMKAVVKGM